MTEVNLITVLWSDCGVLYDWSKVNDSLVV